MPSPADDLPVLHPGGTVRQAQAGGYFVASMTKPGHWYLVHGRSCSCDAGPAGAERCVHRAQVARFVAALDAELARPIVPVNVSAMVD